MFLVVELLVERARETNVSKRDQEASRRLVECLELDTAWVWFAAETALRTLRHSSVRAWTGSSYSENSRRARSSSRYWKCLPRRSSEKGVGETVSTIICTLFVEDIIRVGVCGGYSVSWRSFCRDMGSMEMPLRLCSGARERR